MQELNIRIATKDQLASEEWAEARKGWRFCQDGGSIEVIMVQGGCDDGSMSVLFVLPLADGTVAGGEISLKTWSEVVGAAVTEAMLAKQAGLVDQGDGAG